MEHSVPRQRWAAYHFARARRLMLHTCLDMVKAGIEMTGEAEMGEAEMTDGQLIGELI